MILDLVLRWIHILSAITLVGGVFFIRFSLLPGTKKIPLDQRESIHQSIRKFWFRCVIAAGILLLVSGLVNAARIMIAYNFVGPYHGLVAVKLFLALAIFWFAALLSGTSSAAEKFRVHQTIWLNVLVLLMLGIVCLGGVMKQMERTEKLENARALNDSAFDHARDGTVE